MQLKKFLLFGLLAAVLPAVAEEAADRKTATSLKYVTHELDTRQNKFTAEQNKAMEYTDSAGDVQKRTVKSDLGTSTSDTSLPMVGGVNVKLATKQDDIAPINDHTAVTYTGQSGSIGAKGIYQTTESYVEQSNNLIDAKTFNAALKRGLDSEFLCSEYKPGTDLCWVWSIHNTEPVSINLFDMSQIPTTQYIVHNADGSITVTTPSDNGAVSSSKTLSQLATGLQVGKTYKLAINTTGTAKFIYLGAPVRLRWDKGTTKTITQDMLDSEVFLYASGVSTTATIYDIQITEVNPEMPFETLVPSGYTPVEYLQSDGHQYIDTEINSGPEIELRYKFRMTAQPSSGFSTVLSARVSAESNSISQGLSGTTFYYGFGNNSEASRNIANITTDYTVVQNKTQMVINGTAYDYKGGYNTNFTTTGHLYMFARNNIGSSVGNFLTGRIYYAQIYNNGTLVRNFIPVKQGTTVGMYDTVEGRFFTSVPSNTNFTAGPDINNIIYVPQNQ